MKASDTVMNDNQIQELDGRCMLPCTDYDRQVARIQAEVSFKAGIQEVVEWVNEQASKLSLMQAVTDGSWQSKLKEWDRMTTKPTEAEQKITDKLNEASAKFLKIWHGYSDTVWQPTESGEVLHD